MKFSVQWIAVLFLLVSQSTTSVAKPRVEKTLRQLIDTRGSEDAVVTAVLVHGEPPAWIATAQTKSARKDGLKSHARRIFAQTLATIARAKGGHTVNVRSFWSSQTIVLTAPVAVLRRVLRDAAEVTYARPARSFHLIKGIDMVQTPPPESAVTYGLAKLGIPELRARRPDLTGRGVRVAILDTGIDARHPDLIGRTVLFKHLIGDRTDPFDDHGHGTHVAGTIAGGSTSGIAIGIAPQAQLLVGKLFDALGDCEEGDLLNGMEWAADPDGDSSTDDGPRIVNNSWGDTGHGRDPSDEPQCRAVNSWRALGILPIFAGGNEGPFGQSISLPAACPNAVAVGGTNENDQVVATSSRGPAVWGTQRFMKPDLTAPGENVFSSIPGGGYQAKTGTSMAAPHAAGLAALMDQALPGLSVDQLISRLAEDAVDLGNPGRDNFYGIGRIQARSLRR